MIPMAIMISGSAANSVIRLRRVQDDAFAEKVKAGAAVHLALDHLVSYLESQPRVAAG